jgi:hypothetical protein
MFSCSFDILYDISMNLHWGIVCLVGTDAANLNLEFCYGVYIQCESFIWLNLMIKTERYLLRSTLSGGSVLN